MIEFGRKAKSFKEFAIAEYYRNIHRYPHRINEIIRSPRVFLINEEGKALGIKDTSEALRLAKEIGLDLVEISPNANPPVCKIVDYGKFRYEQEKKLQKNKTKQKYGEIKEIRLSAGTDEHDFETKIGRARKFIEKGHKIRATVKMSGRENIYHGRALAQLDKLKDALQMEFEQRPLRMGNRFSAILIKNKEKPK